MLEKLFYENNLNKLLKCQFKFEFDSRIKFEVLYHACQTQICTWGTPCGPHLMNRSSFKVVSDSKSYIEDLLGST